METRLILDEPIVPDASIQILPVVSTHELIIQADGEPYVQYTIVLGIHHYDNNFFCTIKDRFSNLRKMYQTMEAQGVKFGFPSTSWWGSMVKDKEVKQRQIELINFFQKLMGSFHCLLNKAIHGILGADDAFSSMMLQLGTQLQNQWQYSLDYDLWIKSVPFHYAQTFTQHTSKLIYNDRRMGFKFSTPQGNSIFSSDRGIITEVSSKWAYFKITSTNYNFTISTTRGEQLVSLDKHGAIFDQSKYYIIIHSAYGHCKVLYITRLEGLWSIDPEYTVHMLDEGYPVIRIGGHWPSFTIYENGYPACSVAGGVMFIENGRDIILYSGLCLMVNKLKKHSRGKHTYDGFTG